MKVDFCLRYARVEDTAKVSSILTEAAEWLRQRGIPLWSESLLSKQSIAADVEQGHYVLAGTHGAMGPMTGTMKFLLQDKDYWPEAREAEAVYVHRLAVSRCCAGTGLAKAMLDWAQDQARVLDRSYLRLDCDAARPQLRKVYEQLGFFYHSDHCLGDYRVARFQRGV